MIQSSFQQRLDIDSPFWQWDTRAGRYRDRVTGKFISQQNLERLQRLHITLVERDITTIGELLKKGQLSLGGWQEATANALKTLHLHQYVLGRGGVAQVTPAEWLAVGRQLREQYTYLRNFAEDINRGYSIGANGQQIPMTEGRFNARLKLYSQAGRISFEMGKQEVAKRQGKAFMRRFLGAAHHCPDCPRYARMGIQPIGVLPLPCTRCACRSNCKCICRYYNTLEEAIASTKI